MPHQILDTPVTSKNTKIRKPYYRFFEWYMLGYYLFIVVFAAKLSFDFPPIDGPPLLVNILLFVLGIVIVVVLFFCYLSIAAMLFFSPAMIFYHWRKASIAHDQSFDNELLKTFNQSYLNSDESPLFIFSIMVTGILVIVILLFAYDRAFAPYFYYAFNASNLLEDSFIVASVLYTLISSCYLFIIKMRVRKALQ